MRTAYATGPISPNSSTARPCGNSRKVLRQNAPIVRVARELFTIKTAQTLADLTGYSVRACEYWISPTNPVAIPADALISLIRSDFGREFLLGLMVGSQAPWWQSALAYFGILDTMKFQRQARRKLKAALDADDDLRSAIARSEAALSVQDADFYGAHLDALRSMGRVSDRAMAPTSKGRGRR